MGRNESLIESLIELKWLETDPLAARCACCGGLPSLWEVCREGTVTKMVNCDRAELHPDDERAPLMESCPMYSPGMAFNKATRREAVTYWNRVQRRLIELRSSESAADLEPSNDLAVASMTAPMPKRPHKVPLLLSCDDCLAANRGQR